MKAIAAILFASVAATVASALGVAALPTPARSVSGQFAVFPPVTSGPRTAARAVAATNQISLDPTLVAVSAERIRAAVWRELGYKGQWESKISIVLRRARSGDETTGILSDRSIGGWNYRVTMPDQISRERYLRTLVQVVLLEFANRSARERSVEIPVWLTEGLAYHLLVNNQAELIIDTPKLNANGVTFSPVVTDARRLSALEKAHKTLFGETPLTFEELSWPAPGYTEGPDGPRFRACAQLLACDLLNLRGGRDCMRNFIAALPAHLNWQMAFLEGFKPHFKRPLDVEKWWALHSTGFANRDLIQTWTYEESWNKLTAALTETVSVYGTTNELPMHAEVRLQAVVRDWDPAKRDEVLRRKLRELEAIRVRLAPELAGICGEYIQTINSHLGSSPASATTGNTRRAPFESSPRQSGKLIDQLDGLDVRVKKLRPQKQMAGGGVPRR
ncbi:MAG: hypothetical protein RLY20_2855 [Verrucomicrobiota bacterium]|jgi:hypothetical protein